MGNKQFDAECIKWMNDNPAPCRRCKDRNASCHSECGRYAEWVKAKEEARGKIAVESKPHLTAYEAETMLRSRGRKRKDR